MGLYNRLNWPKRASAVFWLLGTLLYPCKCIMFFLYWFYVILLHIVRISLTKPQGLHKSKSSPSGGGLKAWESRSSSAPSLAFRLKADAESFLKARLKRHIFIRYHHDLDRSVEKVQTESLAGISRLSSSSHKTRSRKALLGILGHLWHKCNFPWKTFYCTPRFCHFYRLTNRQLNQNEMQCNETLFHRLHWGGSFVSGSGVGTRM